MLTIMLMAGCKQAQPPAESSATAATAEAPIEQDAEMESTGVEPAQPTESAPRYMAVNKADLVGIFTADGVETRTVELKPDGRYALKGGVVWDLVESRWSLENDGTHLRLHHDHQQTEDLLFGIESADVLVLLNPDGTTTHIRSTLDRVKK